MRHGDLDASINAVTGRIVAAALEVHRDLGPGLLEHVYKVCLQDELQANGLIAAAEVPIAVHRRGRRLDIGFRADLIVERRVLVEVKAVEELHPSHAAQVLTYLRWTGCPVALLLNFQAAFMKDGIHRLLPTRRSSGSPLPASSAISAPFPRSPRAPEPPRE